VFLQDGVNGGTDLVQHGMTRLRLLHWHSIALPQPLPIHYPKLNAFEYSVFLAGAWELTWRYLFLLRLLSSNLVILLGIRH